MRTLASPQHSLGRQSGPPGRMARARATFSALCLFAALAALLLNLPPAHAQQPPSQDAITTLPLFPVDWTYYLNSGSGGVQGGWVYLIASSSYQHARYNPGTQTWEILNVGTPSSGFPAIASDASYLYMVIPVEQNPAYRYPWVFRALEPAAGRWLFQGYMYNYPVGDIKGRPLVANGKTYFCFWTMSSPQVCRSFDLASQTHTGIATIPFWQSSAFQLWVQDPTDSDKALVLFAPDASADYRLFSYSFSQDRWDVHSTVCGGAGLPRSLNAFDGRLYVTCLDKVSSPTQTRFFVWDRGQWRLHAVYDLATLEATVPLISVPGYGLLHFDLRGGRTVQRKHFLYRPGTQPGPGGEPLPTPSPDPPRVVSTTPSTGTQNVAVSTSVTITFDRLLDPATVTTENFLLREGFLLGALPRSVSWSASTKSVTIAPSSLLRQGTTHLMTVGGGVRSIDGVAMGTDYTFSFVTQGARDYLAPTDPLAQPLYNQYANLVDLITSLSGTLATLSFVWGGYTYMNAGGDPRRAEQGRNAMLGALSGLLLVLLSRAIVAVLLHNITVVTP